ncbi:RNA-binding protein, putative [Plasmodium ovale]|uniref:RNA-binding protein, putative n=2 Tax=Plasmodium ovale TaxID=36330 RepID=A0A1A8VW69_PLAOA|nr:RNA-binding protein, putative [Plasmodium ovale curtisi]SBS91940.1 RNA-binding protein, putative [Plasmodium ovale curtisi]SCP04717.1 RNA-binding protein, putative [Plasmodium ovale]
MKGSFYETNNISSNDNVHDDFLNYPNFKKFIDSSNNNDRENFEESRKYIHREITKTLNANSMKTCRNLEEKHEQSGNSSKSTSKILENQHKKEFAPSCKEDMEAKWNRNYGNYGCISGNLGVSTRSSNWSGCTSYGNVHAKGSRNNSGKLSAQKSYAVQNELQGDSKNMTNYYRKKGEINSEDVNLINETILLREKKNLLKHEFFSLEQHKNMLYEKGNIHMNKNLENFIFTNEEKLNYVTNNREYYEHELYNKGNNLEDTNSNLFNPYELNSTKKKSNKLVLIKEEEKKKKKKEKENMEHYFNNQVIHNGFTERNICRDKFKGKTGSYNVLNCGISNCIGSNNVNTYGMHTSNMYRHDNKMNTHLNMRKIHEKRENCKIHRIEHDPNKFKKYNNLKENFYLNNNQRYFYTNVDYVKNKPEYFQKTDAVERIYANNIMYDDYFTIENMEKCDDKEYFKKEEYGNGNGSGHGSGLGNGNPNSCMKRESMLGFNLRKNFHRKETTSNKKKFNNFVERNDKMNRKNVRDYYLNESNIHEFTADDIMSEYGCSRREFLCSSTYNDDVSTEVNNEEGDTVAQDGKLREKLFQQNKIFAQGCDRGRSGYGDRGNEGIDVGIIRGNFQGNVYTSNNAPVVECEAGSLTRDIFFKRDTYYRDKNDIISCENHTRNGADVGAVSGFMYNGDSNNDIGDGLSNVIGDGMGRDMISDVIVGVNGGMSGSMSSGMGMCSDTIVHKSESPTFEPLNMGASYDMVESKDSSTNKVNGTNENEDYVIKLFFGNLAPITTEKDMHNLFSNFGKCDSLIILKDRRSKSRGSGFVTFYNMNEAINAIKSLNNKIILSGAHKPLEVRFPENKEEKKLRTKLLNAAKWKGKKIAPSGCLPINTEDILNPSSLNLNSSNNVSVFNANDSSYFFSENDNTSYDHREVTHLGCSSSDLVNVVGCNQFGRPATNQFGITASDQFGFSVGNQFGRSVDGCFGIPTSDEFNCADDFSEAQKTTSITTNDTLNPDYFNRMEESNKIYGHDSFKMKQENLSDDMDMNLLMHRKSYNNLLPNFLFDNKSSEKLGANSFEEMPDGAFVYSNNADIGNSELLSNLASTEMNDGQRDAVSYMSMHPVSSKAVLRSSGGSVIRSDSGSLSVNSCVKEQGRGGGQRVSYFSNFLGNLPHEREKRESITNPFFSCLDKGESFVDEKDGWSYDEPKQAVCSRDDVHHMDEMYEQNNKREQGLARNVLRIPDEIHDIVNEDNIITDTYEGNKSGDNSEGYNNINVHYLGFNLSHLIRTNEGVLQNGESASNVCTSDDETENDEKKKLISNDYERKDQRRNGSNNSANKWSVANSKSSVNLTEEDENSHKHFEINDSLSDEMLKKLISLYTKNKSSIFTSHMFSYLNNVLCEINNALEIFNKFNVNASIKNMRDNKKGKK